MLRKRFGNFRIQLIRDDDQPNDEISFKETLRISWLLYWRSMILNGVVGFMFPGKSHTFPEALWNPQSPDWVQPFQFWQPLFFGYPWAVSVMLKKRFAGFWFSLTGC
jgi:hypothetical protein